MIDQSNAIDYRKISSYCLRRLRLAKILFLMQ